MGSWLGEEYKHPQRIPEQPSFSNLLFKYSDNTKESQAVFTRAKNNLQKEEIFNFP